jgi:hypothetical protein
MKDIEEVKDEFRTKILDVHMLIKNMREESQMSETDLDGIESLVFDLGVCFRHLTR